jgi:membrane protein implicated in regulation of membrane protease activity
MNPSLRKALGAVLILGFLTAYVVLVATVGSQLVHWPWWAQTVGYAIAGIAWVFPLKPLFSWMNRPL